MPTKGLQPLSIKCLAGLAKNCTALRKKLRNFTRIERNKLSLLITKPPVYKGCRGSGISLERHMFLINTGYPPVGASGMATRIPRRNPNNINLSRTDAKVALAPCPLNKPTMQLVPLRYGLVDNLALDPAKELLMAHHLSSRPLGVRLPRDGWLYVIDTVTGVLSEYRLLNGVLTDLLFQGTHVTEDERQSSAGQAHLIVSRHNPLYVSYAEVQWTAKKCHQVLDSPGEREHFMQAVHPAMSNCQTGGAHLLTPQMTEEWLAEVATEFVEYHQQHLAPNASLAEHAAYTERQRVLAQVPEHERQPYTWEEPKRFAHMFMGKLVTCVAPGYHYDTLYLVLDDTLGVLRDLANYQDQVAGWVTDWANGGAQKGYNERDYLLGCYIESLTWLAESDVQAFMDDIDDPAGRALLADLNHLPEPEREITAKALHAYINRGGLMTPSTDNTPTPADLQALRQAVQDDAFAADFFPGSGQEPVGLSAVEDVDRRYYTREHFRVAPAAFVDTHFQTLIALGKRRSSDLSNILHGARLGQRGVNDLIDRQAMDSEMHAHRTGLERWNSLLDHITADRVGLVSSGAFHKAAWYFDAQHSLQTGHAFALEYACLKDICRSDDACTQLLAYAERKPQFSRPLYYTLPLSEQTSLWVQYAFLFASGMAVLNNLPEQIARLDTLERGRLPILDDLPDSTRNVAQAAQNAWTPALNRGLDTLLASFEGIAKGQAMPDLDQLLRSLPQALILRIVQAAKTEGATLRFASRAELDSLRETLSEVLEQRERLLTLKQARQQSNRVNGHHSAKSQALLQDIHSVRWQLDLGEARLAASISPITELPDEQARLYGSTPGRAGLTVIFAPEGRQQVARLMRTFKEGVSRAPASNVLGDGAALLLFVAQAVNLVQIVKEFITLERDERIWGGVINAALATGAAGFSAVQGIFDTALITQAAKLTTDLRKNSLSRLHVSMGKLHLGLGFGTYLSGLIIAFASLYTNQHKWAEAVRNGNREAQIGATLLVSSSGGLAFSNAYGLSNSFRAAYNIMMATKGAAREAAWVVSGVRLSTVFYRFSLAGGLFTLLELGSTWLYNRFNTSAHDQWVQSTPWGLELQKRKNLSLKNFQGHLELLLQVPFAQVKRAQAGSYLTSWLPTTHIGEVYLCLPGLSLADFEVPLGGRASHGLKIGAQRFTTVLEHSKRPHEHSEEISEQVSARLFRVHMDRPGLILSLSYPRHPERINGKLDEELLLELKLWSLDEQGQQVWHTHRIRFNPLKEGRYPAADYLAPALTLLPIDILALEVIPNV